MTVFINTTCVLILLVLVNGAYDERVAGNGTGRLYRTCGFGIGKFGGLVRVPTGESYQEMIRIVYKNNDKVDVSIHSLYKISKYRSADTGEPPRLSTLGTGAWDRMKEKAKKRIKDIARDLIKLYAKRRHEKGYAFSLDGYLQHELEASFLYEDTPDQNKATMEVKADMESSRPMDRLVCGDVGFGKRR